MSMNNDATVKSRPLDATRKLVLAGLFGALSTILMLLDFPVPLAPTFVKFDFSELPVILGGFLMGPQYGCAVAMIKVLLKFVLKGTSTMGVGELANLAGSLAYVLPASLVYYRTKTRKKAIAGLTIGTLLTSIVMCFMNAFVLIPMFVRLFGMTEDMIVSMGTATNPLVTSMSTMVFFSIFPFNIVKYGLISLITVLVYKKLSRALKGL